MIDSFFEMVAERALFPVCIAAWRSLPLFGFALVFQLLTRSRIAARYHCLLWMLVVVRMMVPYSVPFGMSIQPHVDRLAEQWMFGESDEEVAVSSHPDMYANETGRVDWQPAVESSAYSVEPTHSAAVESGVDWVAIVAYSIVFLWPIGAILLIGRNLITYFRFALRLRRSPEVTDPSVIDIILRVCDQLKSGRRPRLKEVPSLAVPGSLWTVQIGCLHSGRWSADAVCGPIEMGAVA